MKPGMKTTEFWVALGVQILGILVLFGVVTPEQSEVLAGQSDVAASGINQLAGAIMAGAATLGYSLGRGNAKKNGD